MERWQCDLCGGVFSEPLTRRETCTDGDGRRQIVSTWLCPQCGLETHLERVNRCPQCGSWKRRDDALCDICRGALKRRFCDFCDELTPEEADVLDDWLDGRSIHARDTFDE